MTLKYLDDNNPDGVAFGQSASSLIGFHGATPTAQATFVASTGSKGSSSNIIVATLSGFAFANSSCAAQLLTVVEALRSWAVSKGFMASS